MNIYDFDKTIYRGDSSVDFCFCCLRHHPRALRFLPRFLFALVRYKLGRCDKEALKSAYFSFLRDVPDVAGSVEQFWRTHASRIEAWYRQQRRADDVIISASPEFLLAPIAAQIGVQLIATAVDVRTGALLTPNCKGEEKVRRLRALFGEQVRAEAFYSDSLSDTPLARLAERAYLIHGLEQRPWPPEP
ncbi:MAG: HAD-IB family phosphatase [Akkermansia sp.]